MENDELKIDGNLAVYWSSNFDFTVEKTTKTLVGSAVSGEGLLNVYRGTGRGLMCPVLHQRLHFMQQRILLRLRQQQKIVIHLENKRIFEEKE